MASQGQSLANPQPPVSLPQPAAVNTVTTNLQQQQQQPQQQQLQQQPCVKVAQATSTPTDFQTTQQNQPAQQQQQKSNNFEPLDKSSSNTLKRNPKMELSKTDLLKLLGYLEGELQGRDIVIAALKSEKMKNLLSSRYRSGTSDPHVALMRDVAIVGGPMMDADGNQIDQQVASLEALVTQQRRTQFRMAKVLKDAEIRHRSVIKELEEEKRKHEHDTAQGDDITYGLEKERTRLKKELELERQEKKHLELELKKENELLEEEKSKKKQIVLLLLAERKKIIMKYIEERKRSEDLAQILSEEKVRIDSMAEGLEEESKKSLQMEAELEKQLAQFDIERQQYRQALAKEEKRSKELESEVERLKAEVESWKGSAGIRGVGRGVGATPPPPPAKPANLIAMPTLRPAGHSTNKGAVLGTGTPMVSSKVVQPTATVTSVPVSGPTTGIARSVTPGQAIRGVAYGANLPPTTQAESSAPMEAQAATEKRTPITNLSTPGGASKIAPGTAPGGGGGGGGGSTTSSPATNKLPFHGGPLSAPGTVAPGAPAGGGGQVIGGTMASTTNTVKKPMISRGIPPPVPPNKPVVPPKKEAAAYLRRNETTIQDPGKFAKPQVPTTLAHSAVVPASVTSTANVAAPGQTSTVTVQQQQQQQQQQSSTTAVPVEEVRHP
ncbi:CTTNBP2 N-terminal-like protein [Venturia canescens]|uniref:CTTNBP2 N-terminal-like protein n=1 Tax=Venturia canescens TaxID=32260 RepID=UPI001C9BE4D2|nr:CTTNBP2 N-terminal-like protein [Venturia canescens]